MGPKRLEWHVHKNGTDSQMNRFFCILIQSIKTTTLSSGKKEQSRSCRCNLHAEKLKLKLKFACYGWIAPP